MAILINMIVWVTLLYISSMVAYYCLRPLIARRLYKKIVLEYVRTKNTHLNRIREDEKDRDYWHEMNMHYDLASQLGEQMVCQKKEADFDAELFENFICFRGNHYHETKLMIKVASMYLSYLNARQKLNSRIFQGITVADVKWFQDRFLAAMEEK